jgi:cell division septation protein DedD
MERVLSRWMRRLGIAAIGVVGLATGAVAIPYLMALSGGAATPAPLPVLPQKPAVKVLGFKVPGVPDDSVLNPPSTSTFVIEVALFKTSGPARRLVERLSAAGLKAYGITRQFGVGIRQQVLIGPYATRAEVDADLARVHQMPGYADARAVERPPADVQP